MRWCCYVLSNKTYWWTRSSPCRRRPWFICIYARTLLAILPRLNMWNHLWGKALLMFHQNQNAQDLHALLVFVDRESNWVLDARCGVGNPMGALTWKKCNRLWDSGVMSNLAISVRDLSKKYGERMAVSHINFDVPLGTVCGFVGQNGSGKTTSPLRSITK